MNIGGLAGAIIAIILAVGPALAEAPTLVAPPTLDEAPTLAGAPCPLKNIFAPVPEAEEVTFYTADLSSAGVPLAWQRGKLGGLHYRLFSDGSGSIGEDEKMLGWRVDFVCDPAGKDCTYSGVQNPPASATEAAKSIGACLLVNPPRKVVLPKCVVEQPAASLSKPVKPSPPSPKIGAGPSPKPKPSASPDPKLPATTGKGKPGKAQPPSSGTAHAVAPANAASKPATANPVTQNPALAPTAKPPAKPSPADTSVPTGPREAKLAPTNALRFPNWFALPRSPSTGTAALRPARSSQQLPVDPSIPNSPVQTILSVMGGSQPSFAPPELRCWVSQLPQESPIATVQRLLLLSGQDGGPVNGKAGLRTRTALRAAIGDDAANLPLAQVISRLTVRLCQSPPRR